MRRRFGAHLDASDVLFIVGTLLASLGVWSIVGSPGAALLPAGIALAVLGFVGILR